ncbi:MAG: hypothetical protein V1731_01410 [Candidatus Aenigmatarchaeota archaeon]
MKESIKSGFSFGITTGIITTLGLITGLNSSTHSSLAVIGGIIALALADGLAESMGMHMSKKSESKHPTYVWRSTFATFFAKFLTTMSFSVPIIFTDLSTAIMVDMAWGLFLLAILTFLITKNKEKKWKEILEHILIAIAIIIISNYAGILVHAYFS